MITKQEFYNRYKRTFPIALDYDALREYNYLGEYVHYNGLVYELIAVAPVGTLPTDTDYFVLLTQTIDNFVSDEDLDIALAKAETIFPKRLFTFSYDESEVIIEDSEFIVAKDAYRELTAFLVVEDIYTREQGVGAIAKYVESTRNQSHMSQTRVIDKRIENSVVWGRFGQNTYGQRYTAAILPRCSGLNGMFFVTR